MYSAAVRHTPPRRHRNWVALSAWHSDALSAAVRTQPVLHQQIQSAARWSTRWSRTRSAAEVRAVLENQESSYNSQISQLTTADGQVNT